MNYISTTELRTKSVELIQQLKEGKSVTLIHRSEVVATIVPEVSEDSELKRKKAALRFLEIAGSMPRISPEKSDEIYRKHMEGKYGKNIS